jgi:hypothetical protein
MRATIPAGVAAVLAGVGYGVAARLGFEGGPAFIATVASVVALTALLTFGYYLGAGRVDATVAVLVLTPCLIVASYLILPLGIGVGAAAGIVATRARTRAGPALPSAAASPVPARRRTIPWPVILILAGTAYAAGAWRVSPPVGPGAMSIAFLVFVPLAVGYLSVALDRRAGPRTRRVIVHPLIAMAACLALVLATGMEGSICVALALPPFAVAAVVGGILAATVRKRISSGARRRAVLIGILLLPYAVGAVESLIPAAESVRTVEARIRIRAGAADVWRNIVRPTGIRPGENRMGLAHRIGFPHPITATLSAEALGGSRYAIFERGVMLRETVTEWAPGRRMAFTVDPASMPPDVLDEHVAIGGRFFDVMDGSYEIVSVAPDEVELRLRTTHRLTTHVNPYAGLWTDLLMRQIQQNLLHVVRARAEAGR